MKKSVFTLAAIVVLSASTLTASAAMGGSAPRPQAMAMGGSAPRPQAVGTLGGGMLSAIMMYFGF